MLFSETAIRPRRPAALALSLAAHGALILAGALLALHLNRVRPIYRESRCCVAQLDVAGVRAVSDANPSFSPPPRIQVPRLVSPAHPEIRAARRPGRSVPAKTSTAPALQPQPTLGTGAGDEDAEPAFPTYFPQPVVADRSLLPAVERKIIVNVSISPLGDVTGETLVQGLGNPLDQIVLDTVRTWRFHPATLNGTAVASADQLVFPFNRDYSSTGDDPSNS